MSEAYEKAKEIAEKLLELEQTRKSAVDDAKLLKEELIALASENSIDTYFELPAGIVFLENSTNWKIADGLKEETAVKSKKPEQLSNDFIELYFKPDLKLSKHAKRAIQEEDSELLSVLVPEEKTKVKITLAGTK